MHSNSRKKIYQVVENSRVTYRSTAAVLSYLDSTGLGVFVGALKKAKQNGRDIHIVNIRDNI